MSFRITLILLILSWSFQGNSQALYWIATDSSAWSDGANWSTTSGGPSCNCIPSSANNLRFDGGPDGTRDGVCGLDLSSVTVVRFVFSDNYDGRLSLNGNDITTTGQSSFINASIVDFIGTSDFQFSGGGFASSNNTSIRVNTITMTNGGGTTVSNTSIVATNSITMTITFNNFTIDNSSIITTPTLIISTINLFLNGGTFNGTTHHLIKTNGGSATNNSLGGNVFNADLTRITTLGTSSDLYLATTAPDDFNGDAYFGCAQNNSTIAVAYSFNTTISGNITTSSGQLTANSIDGVSFGYNTGVLILDGTSDQTLAVSNATYGSITNVKGPIFGNVRISKPGGSLLLNSASPIGARPLMNISKVLDFQSGIIVVPTSTDPLLQFNDGATAVGASDDSFVNGRTYKAGDDAFVFPVGANGFYRPISMSAPATTATFHAQYFQGDAGSTTSMGTGVLTVSAMEYWMMDRTSGTADITVGLTWNENALTNASGYVQDKSTMLVTYFTGTTWNSLGGTNITGDETQGQVDSQVVVPSFANKKITLGSSFLGNALPVSLISFSGKKIPEGVLLNWVVASEINSDYFLIEYSEDGTNFLPLEKISGRGTNTTEHSYSYLHTAFSAGVTYYRLSQADWNSQITTVGICAVTAQDENGPLYIWPTYLKHNDLLHLSRKTSGIIFDCFAKPVITFSESTQIDVSILSEGPYIIKDRNNQTARFIISN